MAKITRVTQKIFAASATNNGVFGSAQAGTPSDSSNIATIMGGAAWAQGWLDAVMGASKFPPLEEFQGIDYVLSTQIAYIMQQGAGIEYDAGTTYYQFSIVCKTGTYQFYGSKTDNNIGNALTDTVNWQFLGDLSQLVANIFTGGTTTGSGAAQVLASVTPATGLTPSNGQIVVCTIGFNNPGACALTITSPAIASHAIKVASGSGLIDPPANTLVAGETAYFAWNSTSSVWEFTAGLALGTAAYKAVSDNAQTTVASVSGATTTNHFLVAADTAGTVKDGGVAGTASAKAASDGSKATVASVSAATTAGHIATFADTAGTVQDGGTKGTIQIMTPLGVGSIICGKNTGTAYTPGQTELGSNITVLTPVGGITTGDTLSGTWQALQSAPTSDSDLFQRIA